MPPSLSAAQQQQVARLIMQGMEPEAALRQVAASAQVPQQGPQQPARAPIPPGDGQQQQVARLIMQGMEPEAALRQVAASAQVPQEGPQQPPGAPIPPGDGQQQQGTGRGLLSIFAQPEGKLALMQILGGLGQGYFGAGAQRGAEQRTAASQARANLTNALSRRARSQGVTSQARPGLGYSLFGALAGAGQMGQQALTAQRGQEQQMWERGARNRELGQGDVRLQQGAKGLEYEGQRVGYEGRRVTTEEKGLEQRGKLGEAELDARLKESQMRGQESAADRALRERLGLAELQQGERGLDIRDREVQARVDAIAAKAAAAGQTLDQDAVKRIRNSQEALQQIGILRQMRDNAESVTIDARTGRPKDTGLLGSAKGLIEGLPGVSRAFPGVAAYNSAAGAIALRLAVATQGSRPSETDREVWQKMVPSLTNSIPVQEAKLEAMRAFVSIAADLASSGMMIAKNGMPLLVTFDQQGRPTINRNALPSVTTASTPEEEGQDEYLEIPDEALSAEEE